MCGMGSRYHVIQCCLNYIRKENFQELLSVNLLLSVLFLVSNTLIFKNCDLISAELSRKDIFPFQLGDDQPITSMCYGDNLRKIPEARRD